MRVKVIYTLFPQENTHTFVQIRTRAYTHVCMHTHILLFEPGRILYSNFKTEMLKHTKMSYFEIVF